MTSCSLERRKGIKTISLQREKCLRCNANLIARLFPAAFPVHRLTFQLIAESLDLLVKTTKHRCGLVLEEDNLLAFVLSPLLVTLSNRLPQSKLKIRLAK